MIILRRRAAPRPATVATPEASSDAPAPPRRGWENLHGEVVGEMRRLGVNPTDEGTRAVRGEWRAI